MAVAKKPISTDVPQANAASIELVQRLARFAPAEGSNPTAIGALHVNRADAPSRPLPTLYESCLCIVAQGAKRAMLDGRAYVYDALNYIVVSMTLPICSQITEASAQRPYLSLRIDLDPAEIGQLMLGAPAPPASGDARGVYIARTNAPLLDAVLRLLRLLDTPADIAALSPLVLREILYRVLTGDLGHRLREVALAGSRANRIRRVIELIKRRYDQPMRMDELADAAHLSVSSLHHQFKAVTAMSPLQYVKQLRLHAARRLMLFDGIEARTAAHRVGYDSPSQFSREYKRLFGAPPRRDVETTRDAANVD